MDVQFTPDSFSPICSSLKELHMSFNPSFYGLSKPTVAFILRHFRQVERLECSYSWRNVELGELKNSLVAAVLHLHNQHSLRRSSRQQKINIKKISSEKLGFIEWTVQSPFNGNFQSKIKLSNFIIINF